MPDAAADIVLPLPANAPRVRRNAFTRWLGRTILRLGGWRMAGAFPDIPKLVLIAAPHSLLTILFLALIFSALLSSARTSSSIP